MMALVRSGPTPEKCPEVVFPNHNIALFLHSSTMTVAPCLDLYFRTKIGIMYSINSEALFKERDTFFIWRLLYFRTIKTWRT